MSARDVATRGIAMALEELRRRGADAKPLPRGRSRNLVEAKVPGGGTKVVYVKTRRTGTWHSDAARGKPRSPVPNEKRFWLFVDLTTDPTDFYVVPEWWMENDIYEAHQAFLARHGGTRPRTPSSTHHGIVVGRITKWRERWDLMGLS